MKILSDRLTTCGVLQDGETVRIDLIDQSGAPVTLRFPVDQMVALSMTIPQLLARAAKARTGDDAALFVFPLGSWSIKGGKQDGCLIATLRTTEGFEVSFSVPFEAGRALGYTLQQHAELASGPDTVADDRDRPSRSQYN